MSQDSKLEFELPIKGRRHGLGFTEGTELNCYLQPGDCKGCTSYQRDQRNSSHQTRNLQESFSLFSTQNGGKKYSPMRNYSPASVPGNIMGLDGQRNFSENCTPKNIGYNEI